MNRFKNYITNQYEAECAEHKHGTWYIKMGFAGFNSERNNAGGYPTKEAAEKACLRFQNRSK